MVKNISISCYSVQSSNSNSAHSVQYKYRFCLHRYMSKQFYIKQSSLVEIQFQYQKTVLFQIIQFNISTHFKCKYGLIVKKNFLFQAIQFNQTIQFSISMLLVLFNPQIGPYQVLPRRARVDLGVMAMKGYSVFPKAPALLGPHHQIVQCHM